MRTNKDHSCKLLETKQRSHHARFAAAYGEASMKPKHHFSLHIPVQLEKMQASLDTKTCERKHRALKAGVEATMQNLQNFDSRLLFKLLITQVSEMNKKADAFWQTSLVAPVFKNGFWLSHALQLPEKPLISSDLTWASLLCEAQQENITIFLSSQVCHLKERTATGIYVWSITSTILRLPWQENLCVEPRHWRRSIDTLLTVW